MKILACTGGIGSGKTYISRIFSEMGIPVYHSDDRAKQLYDTNPVLLQKLVTLLGDDILKNGHLQKNVVASKIFNNAQLLEEIERIVHPAVLDDFNEWMRHIVQSADNKNIPFVVFESAIVLEKPVVRDIADKILTVSAPVEMRIERVMARDHISREKVLERMKVQWDDNKREALSDFIIFADCKTALLPQVLAIKEAMCKL